MKKRALLVALAAAMAASLAGCGGSSAMAYRKKYHCGNFGL